MKGKLFSAVLSVILLLVVAVSGTVNVGYVNLCANLGIVKGFGDGSFKPGQSLTTAEAVAAKRGKDVKEILG